MAAAGTIRVLPPEEARKIAAGEVIDRPAALIREFLDNAIDADASGIEVSIEGGGGRRAEVSDDGRGMGPEDLGICWLAHATSKIRSLDDLNVAETLGFRGEALAAAAAVARLEIASCTEGGEAWRLEVGPGEAHPPRLERVGRTRGSTVRALNLFDTIPARKQFLKREGTEGSLCRQVFVEKALAFPEIAFRLTQDGRPKDFLPAAASKRKRFAAALLDPRQEAFLHEIHVLGDGFSADIVIGGPELFRSDRRMLYVFANGRRIQDFSLMQAMEYGTQGWFPNGTHPLGAVHVDIDPALADFNIHPAKREARFKDPGAIHHAVSSGLRDFCRRLTVKSGAATGARAGDGGRLAGEALGGAAWEPSPQPAQVPGEGAAADPGRVAHPVPAFGTLSLARMSAEAVAEKPPVYGEARYAGKAFGLFLLAEWGDRLFVIDQHAAHERVLYDRFLSGDIPGQELLVPLFFATESAEDDGFIEAKRGELARLAIAIERDGDGWRVDSLPANWKLSDSETVREILDLRNAGANIAERWAAVLCCHQAVRDGDYLDDVTAASLAREALALPDPRCPHGRPVWTEISREALCRAVRRG
ncbi:MAG: DNA mismatch repair endonuclease MutL [Treponema sp.]|nr:DNA mismatch repair endonuclease MutL [Treponema sp.]